MSEVFDKAIKAALEGLQHPLAVPILVGVLTVFFVVVVFFSLSKKGKKQVKRRTSRGAVEGGTKTVDGVRRSTRAHKTASKLLEEEVLASPAPRKSSSKKAPETPKEATTVTPKRRGRPPKTPVAADVDETPKQRGRPRGKSVAK